MFFRNCHSTTFFCASLSNAFISFCLISHQSSTNVTTYVYVRNINGQNLKGSTSVQAFFQYSLRNIIRVLQNVSMFFGRTYISYDTFANAGDNGSFACTANQSVDISTHGNTSLNFKFDTVLCHSRYNGSFDNFRVNAHLHCFQNVTTCKVNSTATFKVQINACSMSCNQSINYTINITTCKIVCFKLVNIYVQASLVSFNKGQYDLSSRHATQAHTNQINNAHAHTSSNSRNPQAHRYEI